MVYTYECTYEKSSGYIGRTLLCAKFRFSDDVAPRNKQTVLERLKLPQEIKTTAFPIYTYLKSNHQLEWLDLSRKDLGSEVSYGEKSFYPEPVTVRLIRPFFLSRLALDVNIEARGIAILDSLFPFDDFNNWVINGETKK